MNAEITCDELVALVKSMAEAGRTGSLFVRTDDRHLIVIGLDGGRVVSITCGPRRGERALSDIKKMRRGTYRFDTAKPLVLARDEAMTPDQFTARLATAPILPDSTPVERTPLPGESERVLKILCRLLGPYLGPITPIICKAKLAEVGGFGTADRLTLLIEGLALEIGNDGEAERFRIQARRELQDLVA